METENKLPEKIDQLFLNCNLITMKEGGYFIIHDGSIAVSDGKISFVGKRNSLPRYVIERSKQVTDLDFMWLTPGFVDCHTHLVFGGSRSDEFEMRLNGATYEEIAEKGGGIFSTVMATRAASREELFQRSSKRVESLLRSGVTTLEIKSGYGLDLETELKMLEVIKMLDENFPVRIEATFLGAHALPPEFKSRSGQYIDFLIQEVLPEVKNQGIATAVDVFCERIAFSLSETERVFQKAVDLGFKIKLHAEQLSNSEGASLASDFGAISCDHLEYLSEKGARKMLEEGVVAVLLPGAFYFLKEKQKPPIDTFRRLKIPMAVSTDLNPGTSPVHSMLLILNMACMLFGLTPLEALQGATRNGARALKVEDAKGTLEVGKDADFVVWDVEGPADLSYLAGYNPVKIVVISGCEQYKDQ